MDNPKPPYCHRRARAAPDTGSGRALPAVHLRRKRCPALRLCAARPAGRAQRGDRPRGGTACRRPVNALPSKPPPIMVPMRSGLSFDGCSPAQRAARGRRARIPRARLGVRHTCRRSHRHEQTRHRQRTHDSEYACQTAERCPPRSSGSTRSTDYRATESLCRAICRRFAWGPPKRFPSAMRDSDRHPFGLGQSVSAGIISARARMLEEDPYIDFLQTDAAITPRQFGRPRSCPWMGRSSAVTSTILSAQRGGSSGWASPSRSETVLRVSSVNSRRMAGSSGVMSASPVRK